MPLVAANYPPVGEITDADFMAAAIGEVGMAWGHAERALLQCRRSGRPQVSNLAVRLAELADELEGIETARLRATLRRAHSSRSAAAARRRP
jgi:hypothetical protein